MFDETCWGLVLSFMKSLNFLLNTFNKHGKKSASNAGGLSSIPGLWISPGEGKGYPLQYSGLENSMDYSPWGHKESDMTEWLSLSISMWLFMLFISPCVEFGSLHYFQGIDFFGMLLCVHTYFSWYSFILFVMSMESVVLTPLLIFLNWCFLSLCFSVYQSYSSFQRSIFFNFNVFPVVSCF